MQFDHVCVIGLGYVGLPTAAVLASRGLKVTGVDVNANTVDTINAGRPHIVEPDLDMVVHGAVSKGWLTASTTPEPADAFIIAVPTPFDDAHEPDLTFLKQATNSLAPKLSKGNLVVVESTVPVGATAKVGAWLADARPDLVFPDGSSEQSSYDVFIAHSPERVLPGRVLLELVRNDRVIGGLGPQCAKKTAELYATVVEGELHLTNAATAELVKLSENAYRDVNIAFANELANVSEPLGINVRDVIALANHHPRVNILSPGPGVGGHCIAVDPWFIVSTAPDRTALIKTAREVNDARPNTIAQQIANSPAGKAGMAIACLGLSYKADIDDLRESPSVQVVRALSSILDNEILVVEPHVDQLPPQLKTVENVQLVELGPALEKAGCIALLTDHKAFSSISPEQLEGKSLIDTRGVW